MYRLVDSRQRIEDPPACSRRRGTRRALAGVLVAVAVLAGRGVCPPRGRVRSCSLEPPRCPAGQTEAFAVYRYHAVFTDSTEPMLAAEATHRDHAIVEQVIAELKNGPLAHLPSGVAVAL